MPSFSGVLTWETMLSSNQRMVMGTRSPHLSHRAVIPHLIAIAPVRLEFGVMIPGFPSMIRVLNSSTWLLQALKVLNWVSETLDDKKMRRWEMRFLDATAIGEAFSFYSTSFCLSVRKEKTARTGRRREQLKRRAKCEYSSLKGLWAVCGRFTKGSRLIGPRPNS